MNHLVTNSLRCPKLLACAFVLPAFVYFLLVAFGLAGMVAPARILLGGLFVHHWITPVLLVVVVGAPAVGAIVCLCLQEQNGTRLTAVCGLLGAFLPVVNLLIILFFVDQYVAVPNFLD